MEAVGLAVGVTSLVSLFTTLLEIQDMVDSYRDSDSDARYVTLIFEAQKRRLEQWFRAVGLDTSRRALAPSHHPTLDQPQMLATVHKVLQYLREILPSDGGPPVPAATAKAAKTKPKMKMLTRRGTGHEKMGLEQQQLNASPTAADGSFAPESKTQRLRWIFRDKAKAEVRATRFADLVQILHDLVPPDGQSTEADAARAKLDLDLTSLPDVLSMTRDKFKGVSLKDVANWLNVDNASVDMFESSCRARLEGTCDWILQTRHFLEWSAQEDVDPPSTRALWIHGPAGFGKSMLCSRIIQHLSDSPTKEKPLPLAYHFYSGRFTKTEGPMFALRSWLSQLVQNHQERVLDIVRAECASDSKTSAALSTITSALKDAILALGPCLLVMDGLDESLSDVSSGSSTSLLEDLFVVLRDLLAETRCRVLILSRDEPEIQTVFQEMLPEAMRYRVRPSDTEADTAAVARHIVQLKLAKKTAEVQDEVSSKMSRLCAGQFLWLKLQRENLRVGANRNRLLKDLDQSPVGLDQTYNAYWDRIQAYNKEDRDKTLAMLRWITFALKPLTVSQLVGTMLVRDSDDGDEAGLCLDDLPDAIDEDFLQTEILARCTLLVEARRAADEESEDGDSTSDEGASEEGNEWEDDVAKRTVHLTHFSVKQFLMRKFTEEIGVDEIEQDVRLARLCLRYIAADEVWEEGSSLGPFTDPFLSYAVDGWVRHIILGKEGVAEKHVMDLSAGVFDPDGPVWGRWSRFIFSNVVDYDCDLHRDENASRENTPLSLASYFGLLGHAERILAENNGSTNIKYCGSAGWNALHAACFGPPHERMVKLLLRSGADVMHRDCCGWTALHYAVDTHSQDLIPLLLDGGADIDATDKNGRTALYRAAELGQASATKMLLDQGADASIPCHSSFMWKGQWTPFFAAVREGNIPVVEVFLDLDPALGVATRMDADGGEMTMLATAFWCWEFDLARYLLKNYTQQVTADLYKDKTCLFHAVRENDPDLVETLLQHGADPLKKSDTYILTPLGWAAYFGHTEVARRLLQHKRPKVRGERSWLDVVREDDTGENNLEGSLFQGDSPLVVACYKDHEQIVELLLEAGSDHSIRNSRGKAALMIAAAEGATRVIELLVAHGADIDCKDNTGSGALDNACFHGRADVAKMLIDLGADMEAENNMGDVPLITAAIMGHAGVVQVLLAGASAMDKVNRAGESALHEASEGGHDDTALLLDAGSAIGDSATSEGEATATNVLKTSPSPDREKVVSLIDKVNNLGHSALHVACNFGHTETARLLLDSGGNVDLPNAETGKTPAIYSLNNDAAECLIRLLLDRGADLSKSDNNNETALHHAASKSRVDIVRLIAASLENVYEEAPTPLMLDLAGRSSLMYSVLAGREANAEILLEMRPREEYLIDCYGTSVMDLAIRRGRVSMVERLILRGGHKIKDSSLGRTTVEWARLSGSRDMVRLVDAFLRGPDSQDGGDITVEELADDVWSGYASDLPSIYCDICWVPIEYSASRRECEKCSGGDWLTCEACFARGFGCMDDTHEMRLRTATATETDSEDENEKEHEKAENQQKDESQATGVLTDSDDDS